MHRQQMRANGLTLRWGEHGKGRPVVLVHGIPTGPDLWRHVLPRVESARCLAWEMVGYADSIREGRGRDISVARQADYLIRWLEEIQVGRVVIVGHDLGGGVAQIAATRKRNLFRGLVLTNSICYDSWPIPSVKTIRSVGAFVERLPVAAFRPLFSSLIRRGHDDAERAAESVDLHWSKYANHDGSRAFVRQVRSLDARDTVAVARDLPTLRIPARVVWGAGDSFQKVHYGERLAADLGASLRRIPGGKHFTPEDHPHEIAGAVNDLLEELGR